VSQAPTEDKEWGTVDDYNRVHVVWYRYGTDSLMYRRSNSNFQFTEPEIELTPDLGANPGVQVATFGNHVYVFWNHGMVIKYFVSFNGGQSFESVKNAFAPNIFYPFSTPRLPYLISVAIDDNRNSPYWGRIYVVGQEEGGTGESNVMLRYSSAFGVTDIGGLDWSDPVQVDRNVRTDRRSVFPSVSIAPNGRVDVAWQQELWDSNSFYTLMATSFKGGSEWIHRYLVSDKPVIAEFSFHQKGHQFIGDYIGTASTLCHAWVSHPATDTIDDGSGEMVTRTDAYMSGWKPAGDSSNCVQVSDYLPEFELIPELDLDLDFDIGIDPEPDPCPTPPTPPIGPDPPNPFLDSPEFYYCLNMNLDSTSDLDYQSFEFNVEGVPEEDFGFD
jgi:hypothetical protein